MNRSPSTTRRSRRKRDGDRELRGRLRQHVRGVGDHDAAAPCRLQVDVVDADAVVGDHLELRAGPLQVRVVDDGVDEGEDSLRVGRIRDQLEVLLEGLRDASRHVARDVHPPLSFRATSQVILRESRYRGWGWNVPGTRGEWTAAARVVLRTGRRRPSPACVAGPETTAAVLALAAAALSAIAFAASPRTT